MEITIDDVLNWLKRHSLSATAFPVETTSTILYIKDTGGVQVGKVCLKDNIYQSCNWHKSWQIPGQTPKECYFRFISWRVYVLYNHDLTQDELDEAMLEAEFMRDTDLVEKSLNREQNLDPNVKRKALQGMSIRSCLYKVLERRFSNNAN